MKRLIEKRQKWDVGGRQNRSIAWPLYALSIFVLLTMFLHPAQAQKGRLRILAQTGGACGSTDPTIHCTVLSWVASTTTGVTYNVYRGTTTGGESLFPLNVTAITGTSYIDLVTLTNQQQTFFYFARASEITTIGGSSVTVLSDPSNEVTVTFPAKPAAPTGATATPH